MAKKQALGKGLSFLIPEKPVFTDPAAQDQAQEREDIIFLPIEKVMADPNQPRRSFDEKSLSELAKSIAEVGIMQPVLVVKAERGKYRIVAGERRYRAAKMAGLTSLPCICRQYTASQLAELSLVENIQREDLNAIEEAAAYRRLLEEFAYTQEELAQRLGKSRPYIANTLRLLQLAPQYRKMVEEGRLSAGHARAVLSVKKKEGQIRLVDTILARALSVRQAEELACAINEGETAGKSGKNSGKRGENAHFRDLEKQFRNAVGMPVKLSGDLHRGKLVIEYKTDDDLERLLQILCK